MTRSSYRGSFSRRHTRRESEAVIASDLSNEGGSVIVLVISDSGSVLVLAVIVVAAVFLAGQADVC